MLIYLDTCSLFRFFDEPTERVLRERAAIMTILSGIEAGRWTWISSDFLWIEVRASRDPLRRVPTEERIRQYSTCFGVESDVPARVHELRALGFDLMDAAHLAIAVRASVDVLVTTDDNLLKRVERYRSLIRVSARLPEVWLSSLGA